MAERQNLIEGFWELVKHHREFVLYRFPSWPDWQITDSADLREGTRFERISPPK